MEEKCGTYGNWSIYFMIWKQNNQGIDGEVSRSNPSWNQLDKSIQDASELQEENWKAIAKISRGENAGSGGQRFSGSAENKKLTTN